MFPLQRHLLNWMVDYMQFQSRCKATLYLKKPALHLNLNFYFKNMKLACRMNGMSYEWRILGI